MIKRFLAQVLDLDRLQGLNAPVHDLRTFTLSCMPALAKLGLC